MKKIPFLKKIEGEKMAGRNKEPIDLVIAKNKKHLSKKEIETRRLQEVKVELYDIKPPDYLEDNQKAEFIKLSDKLKALKIISELDEDALARYIITKHEFLKISNLLKKELDKTRLNMDKILSFQRMQDKIQKQLRLLAADMGLTISSRARLVVPISPEQPKENRYNKFIK